VNTSLAEFIVPFGRARLLYKGLVLLVLVVAAGAVLLLVQNSFRSLQAVTAAADQIEVGNMRPWLPPPGDDEVGRLSLALRRMTERLDTSIQQAESSQKLAAVGEVATYLSHEIRNPLSSIRLSLQSLHRDLSAGFIPNDSARIIHIALGEVKRLDGVVRAVLEMGRPAGAPDGRTCRVHQTLEDALDVLRPKVRAQGIELEYVPRANRDLVHGDGAGLRSVVINLVVNAIDVLEGQPDGRIRISTWSGGQGELHIRLADNGPGVPPDIAESIFEPFFTTKARGNGIGLPTALRTVQPWGGTISLENVAAGSGAVFVVKLRLAESTATEPAVDGTLTTARSA
jgi:signal transduction histidine kinase